MGCDTRPRPCNYIRPVCSSSGKNKQIELSPKRTAVKNNVSVCNAVMSGRGAGGGQPENRQPENSHQAIFHPTLGRHAGEFSVRPGRGWKTPRLQINWGGARERTSENQSLVTQSSKVPSDVTLRGRRENRGNGRIVGARKIKISCRRKILPTCLQIIAHCFWRFT